MTVWQAIVLGLTQGVTEFLPISSSGFLILIPELFGWTVQSLAFDALLHLATLSAVVVALWPEVRSMVMAFVAPRKDQDAKRWRMLASWIVLATIPVVIVGVLLQEVFGIEFRSVEVVAWSFIVWGGVLYLVDRLAGSSSQEQHQDVTHVGWRKSFLVGLAQAIALIPGTSRSGITITAGMAVGLSRETAARFSFLLAIPTIFAAGVLSLGDIVIGRGSVEWLPILIGSVVAFVSALLTIRFLLQFLKRYTFSEFAIFRIIVGVAILLIL